MRTDEFDYSLPAGLIAQHPLPERSLSRLLVLNRPDGRVEHSRFRDITAYLKKGDLIVVNDTRVIPARLTGVKETGGRVDILLVEKVDTRRWSCLVTGLKKGISEASVAVDGTSLIIRPAPPVWLVEFPKELEVAAFLDRCGRMPLPHYIRRAKNDGSGDDNERYQTVYAQEEGSIAAPTAGLHFDADLMDRIGALGVGIIRITLHVGIGTFFLIKSPNVEEHEMHREYYSLPAHTLEAVRKTKESGGRVIAVGTTSVRTLETVGAGNNGAALSGYTNLFIYPGYRFRVVDALITNFHLPRSTPLLLVCAFAGKERIESAYREAIGQGYRFYSYGDAMFIS